MSDLNSLYIKKETLKTILATLETKEGKEAKGIELTIDRNKNSNDYGQNVAAYVSQTKEQRDQKKPRFYVGNGKTFWTDGENVPAIEAEKKTVSSEEPPF